MSSLCTRRGFKDTAVLWYNLQLEQVLQENNVVDVSFTLVEIKRPHVIFSKQFFHFSLWEPQIICRFYTTPPNKVPKCTRVLNITHYSNALHVSVTCIACSTSISTHALPVTMATEATWCLSEYLLELQHQSFPGQWALRKWEKERTLLRNTGI